MPRTDRTDRRAVGALGMVIVSTLTAGCVAMPSDGSPERVELAQAGGSENLQVRVFPVAPQAGDGRRACWKASWAPPTRTSPTT